jgi:hypothetical protein
VHPNHQVAESCSSTSAHTKEAGSVGVKMGSLCGGATKVWSAIQGGGHVCAAALRLTCMGTAPRSSRENRSRRGAYTRTDGGCNEVDIVPSMRAHRAHRCSITPGRWAVRVSQAFNAIMVVWPSVGQWGEGGGAVAVCAYCGVLLRSSRAWGVVLASIASQWSCMLHTCAGSLGTTTYQDLCTAHVGQHGIHALGRPA